MLKKFAEELKENRLKKDITLQQISNKTKIDIKFLDAIENGNFEVLPEVYLKAFIKSYAGAVGLDENTTLKKFEAAKTGKSIDERNIPEVFEPKKEEHPVSKKEYITPDSSQMMSEEDEEGSSRIRRNNLLLFGLGLGLIVIIVIGYLLFFSDSSPEIITEKPDDEIIREENERFEEETIPVDTVRDTLAGAVTQAPVQQSDSLNLLLRATLDTTWIRVTSDDFARTQDFLLAPNTQKIIRAKRSYRVSIGNAGSIQMFLNNKPLNFTGKRGEVKYVRIDSTGLQYISMSKTPANQ